MVDPLDIASGVEPRDLERVADMLAKLAQRLRCAPEDKLAQAVIDESLDVIPEARWSSITVLRDGRFTTLATSDDFATRIDAMQYEVSSGPCLDAIRHGTTVVVGDLAREPRWPAFSQRAASEGVASVLAHRLQIVGDGSSVAALNLYADKVDAFDHQTRWAGAVLATFGALGVSLALSGRKLDQLQEAVKSNREIGMAMGVLMGQHQVTKEQSFDLLRLVSQDTNRPLVDIASEVVLTGGLDPAREEKRRPR